MIYQRCDAHEVALGLADQLEDWLPETGFAWGQRRVVDISDGVPGAAIQSSAEVDRVIEVYPDEDASWLLWERGSNARAEQLGLSATLVEQCGRWGARWRELVDDPAGVDWLSIVTELEPERRRLVAALRREVPSGTDVAEPIRLDEVTRTWLAARWPTPR